MKEYPNRATHIICDYIENKELNGPVESIQPHFHMLYMEAKEANPFLGSCVKEVYNNTEWEFVKQYFKKEQ